MSNYEIECDKCGSHKVVREDAKSTMPQKPIYKMSDVAEGKVPKPSNIVHVVMTYTTYNLRCENCGHKVGPITESNQLGTVVGTFNGSGIAKQPLRVNPKSHHQVTDLEPSDSEASTDTSSQPPVAPDGEQP